MGLCLGRKVVVRKEILCFFVQSLCSLYFDYSVGDPTGSWMGEGEALFYSGTFGCGQHFENYNTYYSVDTRGYSTQHNTTTRHR